MILVMVSGYFNPLHVGHLKMLNDAKRLGNKLVVIVNNDEQVLLKGSTIFMNERDRLEIIKNLSSVDYAIVALDEDGTVCKMLSFIKPDIFANGGDVNADNCKEEKLCKKLGIKTIYGVGGTDKIQSSSSLLNNLKSQK